MRGEDRDGEERVTKGKEVKRGREVRIGDGGRRSEEER